ncbi:hypothetical protein RQP46_007060 [Phenoliferia psychrophenolica]
MAGRTRRAIKLRTPLLPLEIIADIIDFAVELLIEEERRLESHVPLSNRFLLSASLVNRAWHPLAVKALLKSAFVTSSSAVEFIARVEAHGMVHSLERVRWGELYDKPSSEPEDVDAAFESLLQSLPGLKDIEISIRQLSLTNTDTLEGSFLRKFEHSPPSRLVVTDTHQSRLHHASHAEFTHLAEVFHSFDAFLRETPHIVITTNQPGGMHYFDVLARLGRGPNPHGDARLESCRFECTSISQEEDYDLLIEENLEATEEEEAERDKSVPFVNYPFLRHLATHLSLALCLTSPGGPPRLASLEILPGLPILYTQHDEAKLFELMEKLPVLAKLKVPASWASDAVRERCEEKGVVLNLT